MILDTKITILINIDKKIITKTAALIADETARKYHGRSTVRQADICTCLSCG
jgi:hypothetical protein